MFINAATEKIPFFGRLMSIIVDLRVLFRRALRPLRLHKTETDTGSVLLKEVCS